MDIITFSEGLQKRMKNIEPTGTDDLVTMGKALITMREILTELKRFTVTYKFPDEQQEIQFFKEVKPVILSQYYYYRKKFEVLLFDSFRDRKSRIDNYYKVLQKLQHFAYKNQSFYEYCMSGATYLDNQYFTRKGSQYLPVEKDEKFSTRYDIKLARILAHEMVKDYILASIRKSEYSKPDASYNSLQWTTQKVALVELIYALHAAGVFNYGKTDVKQIVNCFEEMFSIDLGNYARVFSEIKIRKSGVTNFMDQLKDRLINFIDHEIN
jgi:hypothetical protein